LSELSENVVEKWENAAKNGGGSGGRPRPEKLRIALENKAFLGRDGRYKHPEVDPVVASSSPVTLGDDLE
jgi:hypothetical protein